MDLEYHNPLPLEERCEIISLIQISTFKSDYIIDGFMLRDVIREQAEANVGIGKLFSDQRVVKILHGCDSDLKYLVADFGITVCNVCDTARLFSFIQRTPKLSVMLKEN